ncbi:MAG TPA: hypothetical protein VIF62_26050 [Labilithrix sp.]
MELENAIDEELVAELEKSAPYASNKLERLRVTPDRCGAEVQCADGSTVEEVRPKVLALVRAMSERFRSLGPAEELAHRARRDDGPIDVGAFDELARRGWARAIGRGQIALAGGALALKQRLDADVRDLARARFGALEEDHPTLLDAEVLARCGYFGSFPQSVCLVSHLREDFDAIESFRRANVDADSLRVPEASALATDAVLRPAVCIPIYRAMQGASLRDGGRVVTSSGRCYRYESRNMEGMRRLWDFSMREIVFLGDVEAKRAAILGSLTALAETWDLSFRLVSASDPFFATVRATKALWQRTRAAKYELVVDAGAPLAAGSVNFAGALFGEAFGITHGGAPATTACVGFGLERLVLALFAQHGFDRARWPREIGEAALG